MRDLTSVQQTIYHARHEIREGWKHPAQRGNHAMMAIALILLAIAQHYIENSHKRRFQ